MISPRMINVKNFKSLKDFTMPLGQFNVLIGSNGSGKTNVLELFKFVNLYVSPEKTPAYPFAMWGGYKNLIWSGKEGSPIELTVDYKIDGYEIVYESEIRGSSSGRLVIQEEKFTIKDYLTMTRKDDKIDYCLDSSFAEQVTSGEDSLHNLRNRKIEKEFTIPHDSLDVSILKATNWNKSISRKSRIGVLRTSRFTSDDMKMNVLPSPLVKINQRDLYLYDIAIGYIANPDNMILLRHLNYDYLRGPTPVNYSGVLLEDGDGMINLMFQWFNKNQKLPEVFTLALEELFPNWQISFEVTQEGNILMNVIDGSVTLAPTSIPDGFYKLLAVLAAIELNPSILLIDEIETSLHGRIIEYVIDLLRETDITVIITTHSPLVVDYVDMDDLLIMENTHHESTCHKISNPEELKQDLADKGITVSESWLYGKI